MTELVACPQCAKTLPKVNRPLYCMGEGTFHAGHGYRMMTLDELDLRHTRLVLAGFSVGAERTLIAMSAIRGE